MKIAFWIIVVIALAQALGDALISPFKQHTPLLADFAGLAFAIAIFGPLLFLSTRALVRSLREAGVTWRAATWRTEYIWYAGICIGAYGALKFLGDLSSVGATGTCFELNPNGPIWTEGQRYVYADCPGPNVLADITLPALIVLGSVVLITVSALRLRSLRPHTNGPETGTIGA